MSDTQDGGIIFKVRKKHSESGPDWESSDRGFYVDGVKMRLALWERVDKNGNTFFTGKVSPFRERAPDQTERHQRREEPRRDDTRPVQETDEIPF